MGAARKGHSMDHKVVYGQGTVRRLNKRPLRIDFEVELPEGTDWDKLQQLVIAEANRRYAVASVGDDVTGFIVDLYVDGSADKIGHFNVSTWFGQTDANDAEVLDVHIRSIAHEAVETFMREAERVANELDNEEKTSGDHHHGVDATDAGLIDNSSTAISNTAAGVMSVPLDDERSVKVEV